MDDGLFVIDHDEIDDFLREISRTKICSIEMFFDRSDIGFIKDMGKKHDYVNIKHVCPRNNSSADGEIRFKCKSECRESFYYMRINGDVTERSNTWKFNGMFDRYHLFKYLAKSHCEKVTFCSLPINDKIINMIYYNDADGNYICITGKMEPVTNHYAQCNESEINELVLADTSCSICLCSFAENPLVVKTRKCNHVFHKNCLNTWLEKTNTCPNCRTNLV